MKKTNLMFILGAVCIGQLLFSCSSVNNDNFASRKYTHFRKGSSTAQHTSVSRQKVELLPSIQNESSVAEAAKPAPVISSPVNHSILKSGTAQSSSTSSQVLIKKDPAQGIPAAVSFTPVEKESVNDAAPQAASDNSIVLYIICAILLPPLAVALKVGIVGAFWLNILLCLLFLLPGIIHALIIVTRD